MNAPYRRGIAFFWTGHAGRLRAPIRDANSGERSVRVEIILVGGNPVGGRCRAVPWTDRVSFTDHLVEVFFQRILHVRIPGPRRIGFRPQIVDVFRAAQSRRNQIINLIVARTGIRDSVLMEDLLTQRRGHLSNHLFMRHRANIADRNSPRGARRKAAVRNRGALQRSNDWRSSCLEWNAGGEVRQPARP